MPLLLPVGFLAIVTALFAWQMIASWDAAFRPLFDNLAEALRTALGHVPVVGSRIGAFAAGAVVAIGETIRRGLGTFAQATAAPLVRVLRHTALLIASSARELEGLAQDTAASLWQLRKVVVPAMIASAVAWIPRHLARLDSEVASLLRRAPVHIVHDITKVANHYATTIVRKAVAIPWPRIRTVEREAAAARKKVDSLARKLAPAALLATVAVSLGRLGLGWVRCSRVKKVGKAVCGMDDSVLDKLLADALLIVGTISLVELAEEMQPVVDDAAAGVLRFWRAA